MFPSLCVLFRIYDFHVSFLISSFRPSFLIHSFQFSLLISSIQSYVLLYFSKSPFVIPSFRLLFHIFFPYSYFFFSFFTLFLISSVHTSFYLFPTITCSICINELYNALNKFRFIKKALITLMSKQQSADPGGRVVQRLSLQPPDCWDRGFESRWGHGCSSLVFVVCCVGSSLCDGLITRS
jgi:hypothetical protein